MVLLQFLTIILICFFEYVDNSVKEESLLAINSLKLQTEDGGFSRMKLLRDNYNASDVFSFSQKYYVMIWNCHNRKFKQYSVNNKDLPKAITFFFHTE